MAEHTSQKLDGKDKRSEHFGPIALTRHVKDAGRALLLYTRRRDNDAGEESRGAAAEERRS
jgi:hypothetical protein